MLLMFFLFFTLAVSSSFALPEMRFVPAVAFSLTADYGYVDVLDTLQPSSLIWWQHGSPPTYE